MASLASNLMLKMKNLSVCMLEQCESMVAQCIRQGAEAWADSSDLFLSFLIQKIEFYCFVVQQIEINPFREMISNKYVYGSLLDTTSFIWSLHTG